MVPIAQGEAYVGLRISLINRDSASAATLFSITVQRYMRDRPVATDSASAATFSITVQRCVRDNRPVAAYRCDGYCVAKCSSGHSCTYSFPGVHVGQAVYYILQLEQIIH